jgi:hypothetical protein
MVFDDSLKLWEAEPASTFTVAAHYSASIDLGLLRDKAANPVIWLDWPGLDSAGAATFTLSILSGAATAPTTVIWTSRVYTLAEAQAFFDTAEGYILPLPMCDMLQFFRLNMAVGTAVVSAGVLSGAVSY